MDTWRTARPKFHCAFVALALVVLITILDGTAAAQAVASVGGIVTDDTGARLPGVTVTVRNQATGRVQTFTTREDGGYPAARRRGYGPHPGDRTRPDVHHPRGRCLSRGRAAAGTVRAHCGALRLHADEADDCADSRRR